MSTVPVDSKAVADALGHAMLIGMIFAAAVGFCSRSFVNLLWAVYYEWRAIRRYRRFKRRRAAREAAVGIWIGACDKCGAQKGEPCVPWCPEEHPR